MPILESITLVLGVAGVVVAVLATFIQYRSLIRTTGEKVDQAERRLEAQPEKAKPAWDLARATLESYFNRNLFQIMAIFLLSVVVMVGGFVVIIWGVSRSIEAPDVIAPAVIATLAGLVTEFIGATFLFIYRSTIRQAMEYLKTLERINSVGMALQILDTISDDVTATQDNLKNKTKAQLVDYIMRQADLAATKLPKDGVE